MRYNIYLSIKFRVLNITLGTVRFEGSLDLDVTDGLKVKFTEHSEPLPATAHKIFDDRGIKFYFWE